MSRFPIYLILVLLISGLWSCFDHRIPSITPGSPTTRLRVKTLTLDQPNNQAKVSSFTYDGQGRLRSILTYQTPDSSASVIEYSNYQYDGRNRLTQLRREVVLHPRSGQPNPAEQYIYSYNGAGQVAEITYVNGGSVALFYNGDNQLARGNGAFPVPLTGFTFRESLLFTFTGKNLTNYTKENNVFTKGGPSIVVTTVKTFAHDDKVNPFYGVYVIPSPYVDQFVNVTSAPGSPYTYFGGVDNVFNLSQNNVQTEVSTVSSVGSGVSTPYTVTTSYQYQYNGANLPTVRIRTTTEPGPFGPQVETLRFEYESY
ncbi:hypothetical protein [Spirosoma arcticum]